MGMLAHAMSDPRKKGGVEAVEPGVYFVTGFPGFIGKRLVEHIAQQDPRGRISCLVLPQQLKEAQRAVERIQGAKVELLTGEDRKSVV